MPDEDHTSGSLGRRGARDLPAFGFVVIAICGPRHHCAPTGRGRETGSTGRSRSLFEFFSHRLSNHDGS